MKRNIFILTMLLAVAAFSIAPVMAPCDPAVEICKKLYCPTGPGWSDNPPYLVGIKYTFWIEITVTAHQDLSDVTVYDRLGAELMIEGITVDEATKDAEDYDFDFDYVPYGRDGEVWINGGLEGYLNKAGVEFDGFTIFWTGNSVKVHFMWEIGDMDDGETKTIWLVVSTDFNPAGKQEYTSCGWYELNSGATVKGLVDVNGRDRQVSAESDSIWIEVICECD